MSSFEVYGFKEGRWTIDSVIEDEREALTHARNLFAIGGWDEVKVVRIRTLFGALSTQSEIFHQKRPDSKDRPITVVQTEITTSAESCATLEDFYTLEGRIMIGRLLRQYLDRTRLTTTELLHNYKYLTKLSEAGNLINAAIHHVARAQTENGKGKGRERVQALEGIVRQGLVRARDFQADAKKKKPQRFDVSDPNLTSKRLRAMFGPELHDYAFLAALTDMFYGLPSVLGKVDQVVDMMAKEGVDLPLVRLMEGMVVDALLAADTIKELLGPHPSLGSSLCALADFLNNRPLESGVALNPLLLRIGALMKNGRAPYCRVILIERLRQGVTQNQPLDKRDPQAEGRLIKELTARLRDENGAVLGGTVVEQALIERDLRQRQALLRAQGLHEVADSLAVRQRAMPSE